MPEFQMKPPHRLISRYRIYKYYPIEDYFFSNAFIGQWLTQYMHSMHLELSTSGRPIPFCDIVFLGHLGTIGQG
jgi:hypothetical protein